MRLSILHRTVYHYTAPVLYSIQQLRLSPRTEPHQRTLRWRLHAPAPLTANTDAYGNLMHTLTISEPHGDVQIEARGEVEVDPLVDGRLDEGDGGVPVLSFLALTPLTEPDAAVLDFAINDCGAACRRQVELRARCARPSPTRRGDRSHKYGSRAPPRPRSARTMRTVHFRHAAYSIPALCLRLCAQGCTHAASHAWADVPRKRRLGQHRRHPSQLCIGAPVPARCWSRYASAGPARGDRGRATLCGRGLTSGRSRL